MQNETRFTGAEKFSDNDPRLVPTFCVNGVSGKWSGKFHPPGVGARVRINFNELGTGIVTEYKNEVGWLGAMVQLDKEPAWRKKQSHAGKPTMVFGAELTPL